MTLSVVILCSVEWLMNDILESIRKKEIAV
jgi:hypothetical protein